MTVPTDAGRQDDAVDPERHLDLSREHLDALVEDIARRSPNILPVLHAVRDRGIGYAEVHRDRSRLLRQSDAAPTVTLIPDLQGRGPDGFDRKLIMALLRRASAVMLVADVDTQDELPYRVAADQCAETRQHVVVIECPREAIGMWSVLAYACGRQPREVAAFINEPDMPDDLTEVDIDDIPPATPTPRGSLN